MSIQQLSNRKKFFLLIALMAIIAVSVAGITLIVLYKAAYKQQSKRLLEIAQNKASYITATAQYNLRLNINNPQAAYAATVEQVRNAHKNFTGIGNSGDIALARIEARKIVYVLSYRHAADEISDTVDLNSIYAVPMKRALAGQSGVMVGNDFRGIKVLAAYQPVGVFGWGVVAKIDYSELQGPYIIASIHSAVLGLVLILLGAWIFHKISEPLIDSAEHTESQLQTILNTVVDGIISTDSNGTIMTFNTSAERIFGYKAVEVIGKNVDELIPQQFRDSHKNHIKEYPRTNQKRIIGNVREVVGRHKNSTTFPMDIALGTAQIGARTVFTAVVRDITERKHADKELKRYRETLEEQVAHRTEALERANRKLEQLAREDALTEIANRRVFDESLAQEIRRAKRNRKPLSLIICDIDYFKNYNDSYGHIAGDKCLHKVAQTIHHIFQRAGELVARYGGEEFAIILPLVGKEAALAAADNIRLAVWNLNIPHISSQISNRVSVSLGIACADDVSQFNTQLLIDAADNALYKAKHGGRNRVEIYSEQMQKLAASTGSG